MNDVFDRLFSKPEFSGDVGTLMPPREMARLIGVKLNTLAQWRCNREDGPVYVKICGRIYYPSKPNQAWIESQLTRSTFKN